MDPVVPRWEWRAFAADFGEGERRLRATTPGKANESSEVYLLSPHCDASVKIRDGLVDIKTLEQVGPNRLEQWRPVMKEGFPLSDAQATRVCAALEVASLPRRESHSLDSTLAELTQPSRGVRTVPIHKKRQRYAVSGTLADLTEIVADGRATRTISVESEDPARVWAAVVELGLEGFENLSYPRGLKRLLA